MESGLSANVAAEPRVVADTHVHLYPGYDLAAALSSLTANLGRTPAGAHAAFFAERSDCRAFAALRDGTALPPTPGIVVRPLPDPGALLLITGGGAPVHLFAGRQLVTAERIEVLALLLAEAPPERLDAGRTIEAILAAGGIPVLGWSPGKWWRGRGRLVRALLSRFGADSLLLGDTALRPACGREPRLMREARGRGGGVIAGTDPLPFPGEERLLGSYASILEGTIDPEHPVESARRLLRAASAGAATAGSRSTWAGAARRWLQNARAARRPGPCAA
jgi:hypothetical protein